MISLLDINKGLLVPPLMNEAMPARNKAADFTLFLRGAAPDKSRCDPPAQPIWILQLFKHLSRISLSFLPQVGSSARLHGSDLTNKHGILFVVAGLACKTALWSQQCLIFWQIPSGHAAYAPPAMLPLPQLPEFQPERGDSR